MLADAFVLFHAEHYGLEATGIGALAEERHPICGPEPMRVGGALEPFVRPAEPRLVRRKLVRTCLFVGGHASSISALRSSTPAAVRRRGRERERRGHARGSCGWPPPVM